jgi:SAM-dependent methyltransferase
MPFSLNLPFPICYPAVRLARRLAPAPAARMRELSDQAVYFENQYRSTERAARDYMSDLKFDGRVVLDVGGGLGGRGVYWLELGAKQVYCIDINRQELDAGRAIFAKQHPGRAGQITFLHPSEAPAGEIGDLAILFDTFEHLLDPAAVLQQCFDWLRPGGEVWIGSIGWYNHMASHCMYALRIPWCQVLFSERAIIQTIRRVARSADYIPSVWDRLEGPDRWAGVTTLRDRPGEPLNMLSLRAIRRVLAKAPFEMVEFSVHGFQGKRSRLARLLNPAARLPVLEELLHSYYTVRLRKPAA